MHVDGRVSAALDILDTFWKDCEQRWVAFVRLFTFIHLAVLTYRDLRSISPAACQDLRSAKRRVPVSPQLCNLSLIAVVHLVCPIAVSRGE